MTKHSLFLVLLLPSLLFCDPSSTYKSLDPKSLTQLFSFYEAYPNTQEGKEAIEKALRLLGLDPKDKELLKCLPLVDISSIIRQISHPVAESCTLSDASYGFLEKITKNLSNRKLQGHNLWDLNQIMQLPLEEIDLSRALFLAEMEGKNFASIHYYEAILDLMALQISLHLPLNASPKEKIDAINDFIFYQMRYRFPPHSIYAKEIDTYTFLSSVIDSRKGVCLGVSVLYLCLAQRLGLKLEAITPPGHIFVRYVDPITKEEINIETTARGIHVPSEEYLSVETPKLQTRNLKEIIGLVFINQASIAWGKEDYSKAVSLYEKAEPYLPEDPLLLELLGYNYLFVGKKQLGKKLLKKVYENDSPYSFSRKTTIEDYLNHKVDVEGIKNLFLVVDEKRDSIMAKQKKLSKTLKKYPKFRSGLFQLASCYLQLGRSKEATKILDRYLQLDPEEILANYYQSLISFERFDLDKAWNYALQTRKLLEQHNYMPKKWKYYEQRLKTACHPPL